MPSLRTIAGLGFTGIGIAHFADPKPFEAIVPEQVPMSPRQAVAISGVAEIVGGLGLLSGRAPRFTRWWLLGLLAAVFPANIHWALHPDQVRGVPKLPRWTLWARLPFQFVFAGAVWQATRR